MLSTDLLIALHNLSRAEKLETVQIVVHEITNQETALDEDALLNLVSGARHEVWSPYNTAATAAALARLLDDDGRAHDA